MFLSRIILFTVLKVLLIMKISTSLLGPTNNLVPQYNIICETNMQINDVNVLNLCTALATSDGSEESANKIKGFITKGQMFMRVYTDKEFGDWGNIWTDPYGFIDEMSTKINSDKLNAVAFDYMYSDDDDDKEGVTDRSRQIADFLHLIKTKIPHVLFGLMLPNVADKIEIAFDTPVVDSQADFYILKSYNYRDCNHHTFHDEKRTTTEEDINDSIDSIFKKGYNPGKTILTMDIILYSSITFRNPFGNKAHRENLTYNALCHETYSKYRTICGDTLDQFYTKAQIAHDKCFAGIYILNVESDDYSGCFGCTDENNDSNFPVLKVLSDAYKGIPKDQIPVLKCTNWKTD